MTVELGRFLEIEMIVKIELLAGRKGSEPTKSDLAKNIDALTRAMSMANAADTVLLMDTKSILEAIQKQVHNPE